MARNPYTLGPLEREIMQALWPDTRATVKYVHKQLGMSRAYTTVMTTMERLFEKGFLGREDDNRWAGYVYSPLISKEELMTQAVAQMFTDLHATLGERQRVVEAVV